MRRIAPLLILIAAALFEVGGDAAIRVGMRTNRWLFVVCGAVVLASYGIAINVLEWDFSRLLGAYVAIFALVSAVAGAVVFKERIAPATWAGLGLILIGGAIIQFGSAR